MPSKNTRLRKTSEAAAKVRQLEAQLRVWRAMETKTVDLAEKVVLGTDIATIKAFLAVAEADYRKCAGYP